MTNMLYILGARLSEVIGSSEVTCRGVFRMAVRESVERIRRETEYHQLLVEHMKAMGFRDWQALLQGESLQQQLRNIGVENPTGVVGQLQQTLVEKQSLFTLTAR